MKLLLCITTAILMGMGVLAQEEIDQKWEEYKQTYGKPFQTFGIDDEDFRKSLFVKELKSIEEHNENFRKGLVSYKIGLNEFSIYAEEEMQPYVDGSKDFPVEIAETQVETLAGINVTALPSTVDWRNKGVINPVKNQGGCGSCWIFSAISTLEAAYAIQKKRKVSLSEQQLVDCLNGCKGGWMGNALKYIAQNGGVNYGKDYPYTGKVGKCRYTTAKPRVTAQKPSGHVRLPAGNEAQLQNAVATIGPISVSIQAHENFGKYKSGVYYSKTCTNNGKGTNHAVTIVGYGRENNQDYWLVRNSWGPKWGDKGYIKMARNRGNNCGIASWGLYPVI